MTDDELLEHMRRNAVLATNVRWDVETKSVFFYAHTIGEIVLAEPIMIRLEWQAFGTQVIPAFLTKTIGALEILGLQLQTQLAAAALAQTKPMLVDARGRPN